MASTDDEYVFHDGSDVEIDAPADDPPRSGEWIDAEPAQEPLTDAEAALGAYVGDAIDINDDEDNGVPALELLAAVVDQERPDGR
jgi:hypothetical protein